jgi:glycosyltransferase involved in cell wall biosynthesis
VTVIINELVTPTLKIRKFKPKDNLDMPKVSVLVLPRNEAHQIADCLNSHKNQTYRNIQVLVLDGRSEDGTVDELRESGFRENFESSFPFFAGRHCLVAGQESLRHIINCLDRPKEMFSFY